MGEIFQVNQNDLPWIEYKEPADAEGPAPIRVKAVTMDAREVPPVQFVEYAPGHTDPVHSHNIDEFFIVTEGELLLEGVVNGPGSVLFIPKHTEYAVQAGAQGARYFRVVIPEAGAPSSPPTSSEP